MIIETNKFNEKISAIKRQKMVATYQKIGVLINQTHEEILASPYKALNSAGEEIMKLQSKLHEIEQASNCSPMLYTPINGIKSIEDSAFDKLNKIIKILESND